MRRSLLFGAAAVGLSFSALAQSPEQHGPFDNGPGSAPGSGGITTSGGTATVTSSSISGAGGLLGSKNLSDLNAPATARTNLGLGTAALAATGSAAGNVPVITASTTLPYTVFIGTATANLANLIPSANVAQQAASGRVSLYMHNSGMALLTSAQRTALAATWASAGVGGATNQGMGEISQFSSQAAANGEKGNFPGGVFPGEVNIDVIPTGSYTTSTSNGDTTSGTVYPGFYSSSDVSAIEASIGYAAVDGAKNAAIFATPNSLTQDLADPFATSSYWAPVRALALYGGGLAIDTPPTFFFYTGTPAYRSMVLQQVAWAKSQGLRVVFVVSPYPINGAATDTSFLANTEALAGYLEAQGDAPTEWVVENYSNPSNGTNDVTSDTDVANSVNQVALYLARSAPVAAASTVAGTFSGSIAQASLNPSGTKLSSLYTGTTHQGTQVTPADNAGSSTLGGQSAGDVGISGGVIINTGLGSAPYLTMNNGPISGASTVTSGLVSLNGNLGTTGIPTTSGLMGVLGWNYSAGLGELDTINLHSTATSSMRWYQLTSGGTYSLLGSLSTSGLSVAGPVSDANGTLAEQASLASEISRATTAEGTKVPTSQIGTSSGQIPVLNGNGQLPSSVIPPATPTPGYVTVPAATSAYISTPSSNANDMGSDNTLAISMTFNISAYPSASTWIASKYVSGGGSTNSEWQLFMHADGSIYFGYYPSGNGSYYDTPLGTVPNGVKGTLTILVNASGSSATGYGQTVPSGSATAVWTPTGGSATVLGSGSVSATNGINKLGTSSGPLVFGGFYTGTSIPMTLYAASLTNIANSSTYANPNIAAATGGAIANDSAGNVWTIGSGATLTNYSSGSGTAASIATSSAAGLVLPDTSGGTTAVDAQGHMKAMSVPVQAALAASTGITKTPNQRAAYQVDVDDFCDPRNCGTSGATIGTDYGSTWTAINTAFPFLQSFSTGGLAGNLSTAWGQHVNYIGFAALAAPAGNSTVTLASANNLTVNRTIFDATTSKAVGVVSSISGSVATISGGIANAVNANDTLLLLDELATTAAAATGATSIPVTSNAVALASEAGWVVWDGNTSKVVGILAANSSGVTNSINLSGSGAVSAVASGDALYIYDSTILNFLEVGTFNEDGGQAEFALPVWQDPNNQSMYLFAGENFTNASCIPAGDTIVSVGSTLGSANYGQIKLATGTTANCGTAAMTVYPTDAQAQTFSPDYLAGGEAMYEAWVHNNPYKDVVFASHTYYLSQPLTHPTYPGDFTNYETIRGSGTGTVLQPNVDFGFGKAALSSVGNSQTQDGTVYRDMTLSKPTGCGQSNYDCQPEQMFGLILGQGASSDHVQAQGFWAGVALANDHNKLTNTQARSNYCGFYLMYDEQSKGNQVLAFDGSTSNFHGAICIDATNQLDSATVFETHIGFSPHGFVKLAPLANTVWSTHIGFVTQSTIEDGWAEADAQSYMWVDWVVNGQFQAITNDNTFIMSWGTAPLGHYGVTEASGNALADIVAGTFQDNSFYGGQFFQDQTDTQAGIYASGTCSFNRFYGDDYGLAAGSAVANRGIPFMACGNGGSGGDGGGNVFSGGLWSGRLREAAAAIKFGAPVTISSTNGTATTLTSASSGMIGSEGQNCSALGTTTLTDPVSGASYTTSELCPVIRSGEFVPMLGDPSNSGLSLTPGTAVAPSTDGSYTSASGWASGVGTEEAAPSGALNTGSNQVGYMVLGR